jgi:hypothetical protein
MAQMAVEAVASAIKGMEPSNLINRQILDDGSPP